MIRVPLMKTGFACKLSVLLCSGVRLSTMKFIIITYHLKGQFVNESGRCSRRNCCLERTKKIPGSPAYKNQFEKKTSLKICSANIFECSKHWTYSKLNPFMTSVGVFSIETCALVSLSKKVQSSHDGAR